MTVKEFITVLLDMDMNKKIFIDYPSASGQIIGNYSRYEESKQFEVNEYLDGVIIGVTTDV